MTSVAICVAIIKHIILRIHVLSVHPSQNMISVVLPKEIFQIYLYASASICRRTYYFTLVCPSVCSSVRSPVLLSRFWYPVCPAIYFYNFRGITLLLCGMSIHIIEVCMATGFFFPIIWKWQIVGLDQFWSGYLLQ